MPLGFQIRGGGASSNVVGIVYPLVKNESTELPHCSKRLLKLGTHTLKRLTKVFPILTPDAYDYQNKLTNNKTNNVQSQRKV